MERARTAAGLHPGCSPRFPEPGLQPPPDRGSPHPTSVPFLPHHHALKKKKGDFFSSPSLLPSLELLKEPLPDLSRPARLPLLTAAPQAPLSSLQHAATKGQV